MLCLARIFWVWYKLGRSPDELNVEVLSNPFVFKPVVDSLTLNAEIDEVLRWFDYQASSGVKPYVLVKALLFPPTELEL